MLLFNEGREGDPRLERDYREGCEAEGWEGEGNGRGGGTTPDTSTKTDVIVYIVYIGNTKTQIYNRNSRLKLATSI